MFWKFSNTNTGRQPKLRRFYGYGVFFYLADKPLRAFSNFLNILIRQYGNKLITTPPADFPYRAEYGSKERSYALKLNIPSFMPCVIVNCFEPVQINKDQNKVLFFLY